MKHNMIYVCAALLMMGGLMAGCSNGDAVSSSAGQQSSEADSYDIDYMVLVNKLNPLPEDWEANLKVEHCTNSLGDDVEVEVNAYKEYLALKEELEAEGIHVDLDSARRTVEAQQEIMDRFTEKYGADYAAKVVAVPGYSEHHTGLALDLYLNVDGKDIIENEDLVQYPEIWAKIHDKLAAHGFILRYLEGKEQITGYAYEPWHIRYIQDKEKAKEIMDTGVTLEGYLGAVNETDVTVDLGKSAVYSEEELKEMAVLIKCQFAAWKDCELHSIRYAGDEAVSEENLKWINSMSENTEYVKVAEFLMDFHSPKVSENAFESDTEYRDYQWWLGCDQEGSWEIVSWGY